MDDRAEPQAAAQRTLAAPGESAKFGDATILGVRMHRVTMSDLHRAIHAAVAARVRFLIANQNVHAVHLYHHDRQFHDLYARASLVFADGMPLVWWAKLMGYPFGREHRVTYVDLVNPLMAHAAAHGWRVFYLGGRPGVAARAARRLAAAHPGLLIETADGYFAPGSADAAARLALIRAFGPQLIMVGMGMPRQERWLLTNWDALPPCVYLNAGACFDYVAGEIPTPPRVMGWLGLEWLYRLGSEPRRLWRRYLVEPWTLLPLVFGDLTRRVTGRVRT